MKVKFVKAYRTKVSSPGRPPTPAEAMDQESYEEGQVVDFAAVRGSEQGGRASASHFINRGVAVELKEEDERRSRLAPKPGAHAAHAALATHGPHDKDEDKGPHGPAPDAGKTGPGRK